MSKDKMVKRYVAHAKFYMMVGGKMTHVVKGTEVKVTEAQAAKHSKKLLDSKGQKALVAGKMVDSASDSTEGVQVALAEMQKQLDAANAAKEKAQAEVKTLKAAAKK